MENEVAQLKAGVGRRSLGEKRKAEPDNEQPQQKIRKESEDTEDHLQSKTKLPIEQETEQPQR